MVDYNKFRLIRGKNIDAGDPSKNELNITYQEFETPTTDDCEYGKWKTIFGIKVTPLGAFYRQDEDGYEQWIKIGDIPLLYYDGLFTVGVKKDEPDPGIEVGKLTDVNKLVNLKKGTLVVDNDGFIGVTSSHLNMLTDTHIGVTVLNDITLINDEKFVPTFLKKYINENTNVHLNVDLAENNDSIKLMADIPYLHYNYIFNVPRGEYQDIPIIDIINDLDHEFSPKGTFIYDIRGFGAILDEDLDHKLPYDGDDVIKVLIINNIYWIDSDYYKEHFPSTFVDKYTKDPTNVHASLGTDNLIKLVADIPLPDIPVPVLIYQYVFKENQHGTETIDSDYITQLNNIDTYNKGTLIIDNNGFIATLNENINLSTHSTFGVTIRSKNITFTYDE